MEKHNRIFQIVIICLYFFVFIAICQNLRFQYLWYDESVQFWISKGLNPDSEPLSNTGGILNVIENNKYYNMDPGGFGILLHFWSSISNHHIWLRILPFLFYIGVVLSFIYLSYKWINNFNIALLIGFVPILYPMILDLAFEVRAYSMETLGAVLCVFASEQLKTRMDYKNLISWGIIFSLFITSRYSLIIVVFVTSLYILYLIFNEKITLKRRLLSAIIYSIPVVFSLYYIYFFALVYQNVNIEPLFYLPYLSNNALLLISPFNFLYISSIGICSILFLAKNRYQFLKKYEALLFITVIVNILFFVLSFMGKHPWSPSSNRCISMVVLMVICFSAFICELLKPLFDSKDVTKYYLLSFILIFNIYERKANLLPKYGNDMNTYFNFRKVDIKQFDKIYVDRWESPYVKYLFEYGELKNEIGKTYPKNFTFIKAMRHGFYDGKMTLEEYYKKQPKMNELTNYELLITPELFKYGNNDKWVLIDNTTNFWIKCDY